MTALAPETTQAPPAAAAAPAPAAAEAKPDTGKPPVPAAPTAPLSKRDARRGLHDTAKAAVETIPAAPPEPAKTPDPAASPAGADAAKPDAAKPDAATGEGPKPDPTKPDAAKPDAAAAAQALAFEIPAEHPASRGRAISIPVTTAEQAEAMKALVKGTYTRPKELEAARTQIRELQEQVIRQESGTAATQKWQESPGYKAAEGKLRRLQELEQSGEVPEGTSADFWRGQQAEYNRFATAEYNERMAKIDADETEQSANRWIGEAWQNAQRLPAIVREIPEFRNWFDAAVQSFNADIELGQYPHLTNTDEMHQAFTEFFSKRVSGKPAIKAALRQLEEAKGKGQPAPAPAAAAPVLDEATRKKIEEEAVAKHMKALAEQRRAAPPHPLGNLAAASRDRVPGAEAPSPAGRDTPAAASVHQLRQNLKRAARQDAQRHLG